MSYVKVKEETKDILHLCREPSVRSWAILIGNDTLNVYFPKIFDSFNTIMISVIFMRIVHSGADPGFDQGGGPRS